MKEFGPGLSVSRIPGHIAKPMPSEASIEATIIGGASSNERNALCSPDDEDIVEHVWFDHVKDSVTISFIIISIEEISLSCGETQLTSAGLCFNEEEFTIKLSENKRFYLHVINEQHYHANNEKFEEHQNKAWNQTCEMCPS